MVDPRLDSQPLEWCSAKFMCSAIKLVLFSSGELGKLVQEVALDSVMLPMCTDQKSFI